MYIPLNKKLRVHFSCLESQRMIIRHQDAKAQRKTNPVERKHRNADVYIKNPVGIVPTVN